MGADVTLVLKANNDEYIQKMKEAQQAEQKVYDTAEKGHKTTMGFIEREIQMQKQLSERRNKAQDTYNLERYNKLLDDSKNRLNNLEQAGIKTQKTTSALTQSFVKLGAAIVAAFSVQKIWEWIKVTAIAYDQQIQAERKLLNALEGKERIQKRLLQQAKEIQKTTIFSDEDVVNAQAFLAAQGRTEEQIKKTINTAVQLSTVLGINLMQATERLDKTYEGQIVLLGRLDGRLKGLTTEQLLNGAAVDLLGEKYKGFAETAATVGLGSVTQLKNAWGDLKETFGEVWSELLRITGIADKMKTQFEATVTVLQDKNIPLMRRWLAFFGIGTKNVLAQVGTDINKTNKDLKKTNQEIIDEILVQQKKFFETMYALRKKDDIEKNKKLIDDYYKWLFDKIKEVSEIEQIAKEDAWQFGIEIGKKLFEQNKKAAKEQWDAKLKADKDQTELDKDAEDRKKEALRESFNLSVELAQTITDIKSNKLRSEENQELASLDKRTQLQLKAAGDNEKKKQEILDKSEVQKAEIERRYKREQQKISVTQVIIDGIASVVKTFAQFGWPFGLIPAGIMAGIVTAQVAAIKAQKFAKGGWTGEGEQRDETGERVAGVVHEKEFVVKRGPAHKFRDVLEAINKEDKNLIINRFNKLNLESAGIIVKTAPVNNSISVDNNGSNSRLDRVIQEQKKLNEQMLKQNQVHYVNGKKIIVTGNKTRIIG